MRCAACDHALWNVRGRICPECGTPFSPSAQRFRPNAVEFCCAHCGQQYYGTDADGLLEPRDFRCVACGQACSMEVNMVLRPAPGTNEADVDLEALPWPPVGGAGWASSALRMLGAALGAPARVGRTIGCGRETRPVAWLACLSVPLSVGGAATALILWSMGASMGGTTLRGSQLLEAGLSALGGAVYPLPFLLAAVGVASAVSWLILRLGSPSLSYGRIFACWAFACAPAVAMSVPCLGLYCGWLLAAIWAPVLAGIALANASRAARSRVVLAAAVPPCVVLLLAAAAVLLPVFVTYTTRGGGGGAGGTDAALVGEEGGGTGDATPEPGPADGSPQPPVTQPGAPAPSP